MLLEPLDPDWSALVPIGQLDGIEQIAGGVRAVTEAGPLTLTAFAPGIFRLTLGELRAPDYGILVAEPAPPAVAVTESADVMVLAAGDFRLCLRRQPLRLELWRAGELLIGPVTDAVFSGAPRLPPFARTDDGWFAALGLASGEPVYGHGEKWGPLNHRGQLLRSRVEDALGVNAEASYKNAPFAWSPRGWGLFVHTPGPVTHGIGHPGWSHRSYALVVEDEALDLFLIAGDAAGHHPGALRLAHRPAAPAAPLEPRGVVLEGLLQRCGRGPHDRAPPTRAPNPGRRHRPRRPRLAGDRDPLHLCFRSRALPRSQGRAGGAPRPGLQGLRLGISAGRRAGPPVRGVRGQGLAAQGPGDRPRLCSPLAVGGAARQRAHRFHPPRRLRLVAGSACAPVRVGCRRHQMRLRRAGAGRLHRLERRSRSPAAQRLSPALPAMRRRGDAAGQGPWLHIRTMRLGGLPALANPLGRRPAVGLGGARRQHPRRPLVRPLGRRLLCHRHRRLLWRPAGCRAVRALDPGGRVRLTPALSRHRAARALDLRRRDRGNHPQLAGSALPADPLPRALPGRGRRDRRAGDAGDAARLSEGAGVLATRHPVHVRPRPPDRADPPAGRQGPHPAAEGALAGLHDRRELRGWPRACSSPVRSSASLCCCARAPRSRSVRLCSRALGRPQGEAGACPTSLPSGRSTSGGPGYGPPRTRRSCRCRARPR